MKRSDKEKSDILLRGVAVEFPFPPYAPQVALMLRVLEALQQQQHALLEAPTGTGKTMALLCSSLAWQAKERMQKPGLSPKQDAQQEQEQEQEPLSDDDDFKRVLKKGKFDPSRSSQSIAAAAAEASEKKKVSRIYFASRTHTQIKQLVKELKRSSYRPNMVVLGSREHYCVHPKIAKTTLSKNLECKKLLKEVTGCYLKTQKAKIYTHPSVQRGGAKEVWDIEDLVNLGREVRGCPYFASRQMLQKAELVFCPYNYLLDPSIRSSLGIKLKDSVVIFDEAHNIESICTDTASFDVEMDAFETAVSELEKYVSRFGDMKESRLLVENLRALFTCLKEITAAPLTKCADQKDTSVYYGAEVVALLESVNITEESLKAMVLAFANLTSDATEENPEGLVADHRSAESLNAQSEAVIGSLLSVFQFILGDGNRFAKDYRLVLSKQEERRHTGAKRQVTRVHFWCMNPAVAFQFLKEQARSILLASGTLSPMDSFASELGADFPVRVETGHVIDTSKQVLSVVASQSEGQIFQWTYKNSENYGQMDTLGRALRDVCAVVPKGVLCFFTSYSMLHKMEARWKQTSLWDELCKLKVVVSEPNSGSMDSVMKPFYEANGMAVEGKRAKSNTKKNVGGAQTGGLLLAVCRGKAAEGIDFADDNARAVVLVGIPYPSAVDLKVKLKRKYNDEKAVQSRGQVLNGGSWYTLQAFRALNQAVGRCIRHRKDYGTILLFDERFLDQKVSSSLSKWIRPTLQNMSTENLIPQLESFFASHAAASQSPAVPALTRSCCGKCGRTLFERVPNEDTLETTLTFLAKMARCWDASGGPFVKTVRIGSSNAERLSGISFAGPLWDAADGLAYATLCCQCDAPLGVKIVGTNKQNQKLVDEILLLEIAMAELPLEM